MEASQKYNYPPLKHQAACLELHGGKHAFALLAEMGTGKTWIIINNAADLWRANQCDAVLVFAPNGVHENWTRLELPKHMPKDVYCLYAAWTGDQTKKHQAMMLNMLSQQSGCLRILTMNWEALQSKRGYEAALAFCKSANNLMIVADESDNIKNPSAVRTKNLMKLRGYSRWRRIMTGTPINNAPFDAFSQFTFLNTAILGTTSFFAFKAEHAEMLQEGNPLLDTIKKRSGSSFTPQVVARGANGRPKYRNLDKLAARIAPHSFRVMKADCLDLPPKLYKTLFFDLTPQQRVAYKQAEDECRLAWEGELDIFTRLVMISKLAQITSGYYLHAAADEPVRIEGDNPKLDLLVERVKAIAEAGGKVIVWARYRVEIQDIVERLRQEQISTVQYHGGVSGKDRQLAIDLFEKGDIDVFVGNQQAGGTGITLVAASFVIYFSNDFSLRNRLQSEDRAHRIGQTKAVTYINLAAKGTIDEVVIRTLANKQDVADAIVGGWPAVS